MTIGKTIKSLRASGKRNTSPVNRGSGGPAISEDSRREAKRLRNEASDDRISAPGEVLKSFPGILVGAAVEGLSKKLPGKILGRGLSYGSAISGIGSGAQKMFGSAKDNEADRIEKGLVKPGEEDRKSGGRVRKTSK